MPEIITLKDIADALQVSIVTVSNALSGKKGVSGSVRDKVIAKAKELGYDISKYEQTVSRSEKIGVIVSEKYLEAGASFYWALYQQVAYAASRKQSFTMFEIIKPEMEKESELPGLLKASEIDGLLVIGWMERAYIKKVVSAAAVPVVLLDFYEGGLNCDAVISGNYIGMYKMTRYLLERGHREIAFVGSVKANENIMDRYYGYRKGLEEWEVPLKQEWILADRDIKTGQMDLELPKQLPTAFVCNSDFTASILYDKLLERGLRIPEDISIVGYDNYLYGHPFGNEITTYNVDMELMAKTAVKTLLKKIKGSTKHAGVRFVDSYIVERASVKTIIP